MPIRLVLSIFILFCQVFVWVWGEQRPFKLSQPLWRAIWQHLVQWGELTPHEPKPPLLEEALCTEAQRIWWGIFLATLSGTPKWSWYAKDAHRGICCFSEKEQTGSNCSITDKSKKKKWFKEKLRKKWDLELGIIYVKKFKTHTKKSVFFSWIHIYIAKYGANGLGRSIFVKI